MRQTAVVAASLSKALEEFLARINGSTMITRIEG